MLFAPLYSMNSPAEFGILVVDRKDAVRRSCRDRTTLLENNLSLLLIEMLPAVKTATV